MAPKPGPDWLHQPGIGAQTLGGYLGTKRIPVDAKGRSKNRYRFVKQATVRRPEAGRQKRAKTLEDYQTNGKAFPPDSLRLPPGYPPTQTSCQESFRHYLSVILVRPQSGRPRPFHFWGEP